MAAIEQEITELMQEHKAIREHTKFLINSLDRLVGQLSQEITHSNQLKERITLYLWSLYDFREAARRHITLDERIFELLPASSLVELGGEHDKIRKQIDEAISLAENAVYSNSRREALKKYALKIKKSVSEICKLVEAHIAKEDELLK
ncbi:MAG: hypothetical protein PHU23_18640 [Dehalococcoidales bacterium]|nr:hypothetical protein [Dehalococcoidales bacterium]